MKPSKMRIKKGCIVQQVPEGIVIFDAEESKLHTFNETAALIFLSLKKGLTEVSIVKKIIKEYDISPEQAKKEIIQFMSRLRTLKIVE